VGATARALGMGAQFEFGDKTYTLSGWTEYVKGQYEQYLERFAIRKAKQLREYFSPTELADTDPLDGARRDVTSGVYSFGQKAFRDSLGSVNHLKHAIYLQIEQNHPEVKKELVDRMFNEVMQDVVSAYMEADSDPNGKTPAPTGVTGE